jgi:hypothetical protein
MKVKVKRLWLPFLMYAFVVGSLLNAFTSSQRVGPGGTPKFASFNYMPDPGPTWFLAWIIIFKSAYCLIGGDSADGLYPAPSFAADDTVGRGAWSTPGRAYAPP